MAERLIDADEALALSGATDPDHGSGVPYPTDGQDPWFVWLVQCINQLINSSALTNNLRVFADAEAAMEIGVRPGVATINDEVLALAAVAELDLSGNDNDTTLVWAAKDGSALTIASAVEGTGWPETPHVPLAEVTITDGAITSIIDRRRQVMLAVHEAAAVADIADPGSASAEDVASKVNDLLGALRDAGLMAGS